MRFALLASQAARTGAQSSTSWPSGSEKYTDLAGIHSWYTGPSTLTPRRCRAVAAASISASSTVKAKCCLGQVPLVFLEHHHAGVPTRPQEHPPAAFVPDANFETESFSVESLGLREVFDTDGDFIKTTNG